VLPEQNPQAVSPPQDPTICCAETRLFPRQHNSLIKALKKGEKDLEAQALHSNALTFSVFMKALNALSLSLNFPFQSWLNISQFRPGSINNQLVCVMEGCFV
jgi:hypothetical protein